MTDTSSDQFLEACGAGGPLQLSIEEADGTVRTSRVFDRPFAVIGRDSEADLSLDCPDVSRRHAYLQVIGGRVFCADLNSRAGTRWGDSARPCGWVDPAQGVRIGPFRVRITGGVGAAVGPDGDGPEGGALPTSRAFQAWTHEPALLEGVDGPDSPRAWRLSRTLVLVGRSPTCKIQLADRELKSMHCSLVRTPAGVWVVDLLAPGGFLVEGLHVRRARLNDGDELRIGSYGFRFRCGPSAARFAQLPALRPKTLPHLQPAARRDPSGTELLSAAIEPGPLQPVDPTVRALLGELGEMRQHMGEQFQGALAAIFRMFNAMHQEQMKLILEELGHLRRLTEESEVLRAGTAAPYLAAPRERAVLRIVDPPQTFKPTSPSSDPVTGVPCPPSPGEAGGVTPAAGSRGVPSPDVHAEIARRIAEIQSEGQGRWQKLMNILLRG